MSESGGGCSSASLHNVFVYGSLLADEVARPNLLSGHPLRLVLLGVTDVELEVLDLLEDVEYQRLTVGVSIIDTWERLIADTYVWGNRDDPRLHGDWSFEEWRQLHMKDFLAMTTGFMEGLQRPESKTRVATYETYFQKA